MIALFTDTDTDITPEVAKEYGYNLISMPYNINGEEFYPYKEKDYEFKAHEFYDSLRHGTLPKTSGLSTVEYEEYFEPIFKQGDDILYVHFSANMSGTFNAMNVAYQNLLERYPDRKLYTIDTKGITILSYNIVREVGDMHKAGKSIDEILAWAKEEIDKFSIYFFADDLKFFRNSGRVKSISAFFGNLLGIRPIIHMNLNGEMESIDKARGRNVTIDKIIQMIKTQQSDIEKHRVIIGHTDNLAIAEMLGKKLQEQFDNKLNIEYVMVNPTAGSHCGPDGVGVCFHSSGRIK